MITIYEHTSNGTKNYGISAFLSSFKEIALNEMQTNQSKVLALMFYDFKDKNFKSILENEKYFEKMNNQSEISIFYMHSSSTDETLNKFNNTLINLLGVDGLTKTPSIVFFKVTKEGLENPLVINLNNSNLLDTVQTLDEAINNSLNNLDKNSNFKLKEVFKGSVKFIAKEVVIEFVKRIIEEY